MTNFPIFVRDAVKQYLLVPNQSHALLREND